MKTIISTQFKKNRLFLLKFFLLTFFIVFLFNVNLSVANAATGYPITCTKSNNKLVITIKVKFLQFDLKGGDTQLASLIPQFIADFNSTYNRGLMYSSGTCKLPVEFKLQGELEPNPNNKKYVFDKKLVKSQNEDYNDNIYSNGYKCREAYNLEYFCISIVDKIFPDAIGYVYTNDLLSKFSNSADSGMGYLYGKMYEENLFNIVGHEMGHLFGLDEEYARNDSSVSNENMMGYSDTAATAIAEQKHIDSIVKFNCADVVNCCPDPPLRQLCCAQDATEINSSVGFVDDVVQTQSCKFEEINICPPNTCGTGTCNADCTCSGGTPPVSTAPPAATTAGQVKMSKQVASPACDSILCNYCITGGTCNVCDLLDVAFSVGKMILQIIGAVTLFFVVWGGFTILTAAGLGQKIEQGKGIIKNALLGLAIAFTAFVMVNLVVWLITGQTAVFGGTFCK